MVSSEENEVLGDGSLDSTAASEDISSEIIEVPQQLSSKTTLECNFASSSLVDDLCPGGAQYDLLCLGNEDVDLYCPEAAVADDTSSASTTNVPECNFDSSGDGNELMDCVCPNGEDYDMDCIENGAMDIYCPEASSRRDTEDDITSRFYIKHYNDYDN